MAKISENKIPNIDADWGLDVENGLPYSGEAVQEFIKKTLKQKYGYFHYDENNNRYLVFSDGASKDLYFSDTEVYKDLLLSSFDAPFNYSAKIEMLSDPYNAILIGTTGNNLKFNFAIEDKSGNNTGENVDCVINLVNQGVKKTINKVYTSQQGREGVIIELDDYLTEGTNNVSVTIKGVNTLAATTVSVVYQVINLQLSDNMDISKIYNVGDVVNIAFTVNGYGTKTVEWYLDGKLLPIETDIDEIFSNSEVTNNKYITLSNITSGVHSLQFRVYTIVDGQKFYSQTLFRNILVKGLNETIIGVAAELPIGVEPFKNTHLTELYGFTQYVPSELRYAIYTPTDSATNTVNIYVNNELQITSNAVNSKENVASIVVNDYGITPIKIEVNGSEYTINTNVEASSIDITEIVSNLSLDLRAFGKNNDAADKESWTYKDYSASFDGFYWNSQSGWVDNTLIINAGATVNINCAPLNPNPITTGKTLEFEFATRNVISDDSVVLDLTNSDGIGLLITASEAKLIASDKSEVSTKFRAGENNRITFVVNMNSNTTNACLMFIYVNGVVCGAARFSNAANIKCDKTITFNSDSDILLKHLRFYDRALSSDEILNNYILYRDSISEMLTIYNRNDVYETGTETLSPEKLLNTLPVMYITCLDKDRGIPYLEGRFDEEAKDENIYCDIEYKNAQDKTKNFKIDYARVRIQGTSSIKYPRKNYRFYTAKHDNTVLYDWEGKVVENRKYSFKDGAQPVNCWCLKADYAESSGAHNTGVARIWNDLMKDAVIDGERKLRTIAQQKAVDAGYEYDVRTCIDGFPIVVFYRMSYNDPWIFLGKYNFNNDKSTESVFGFKDVPGFNNSKMQCWEVLNNGHELCNFTKYDSEYFDNNWEDAFEARYPDDGSDAYTGDLKRFCEWIYSTKDNPEKFRTEKDKHIDLYKMAAYYVYIMRFGAVDQTVKNSMFTSEDGNHFYFINYDNDTILGLKNDGSLRFDPDVDRQSIDPSFTEADDDVYVYAGHDSVLWNNLENDSEFMEIVKEVDHALYSAGLTYDNLINMFEGEQTSKWCERVFNRDAQYKYIIPDNGRLLSLQGPRDAHRRWWLSQRFNIYDAKFLTGDFSNNSITFKLNGAPSGSTFKIKAAKELPYGYAIVNGASEITPVMKINEEKVFTIPQKVNVGDPVSVYGAPNISEIDLSSIVSYMSEIDFTKAYSEKVGCAIKKVNLSGNNNAITAETLDGLNSLEQLTDLDIQNLKALNTLNVSNLINLKTLKAIGSGLTSVDLAPGCLVERLELPVSMEVVSLVDLPLLTADNIVLDGNWSKVREVRISGCPNLTNDFNLIWDWFEKTSNIDVRTVELHDINWKNVNIDQLIELGQNTDIILRGTIELVNVDDKLKLKTLKELYGNNIFNSDSDLYIFGPDAIYLFGPEYILEGENVQLEYVLFTKEKGTLRYGVVGEQRHGMNLDQSSGFLSTIETGIPSTNTIIRVEYKKDGVNIPIFNDLEIEIRQRTYPSSLILTGSQKIVNEITEYSWTSSTQNITGIYDAEWELKGDITNYASIISSNANNCVIKRHSIPETLSIGTITIVLKKNFDKTVVARVTTEITLANPDVIMTFESNSKVLNILYTHGLCNSNQYLLKSEIINLNTFIIDGESIFKQSDIDKFPEFKEFKGFTTLDEYTFDNCTNLTEITLPDTLNTINECSFYKCSKLTSIVIPEFVSTLDQGAFKECTSMSKILVDSSNIQYWSGDDGCVYQNYGSILYMLPPNIEHYVMPDSVIKVTDNYTKLWNNALELKSITFNSKITGITSLWWDSSNYKLEEFLGPDDNLEYSFKNGIVYSKDCSKLIAYPRLKNYSNDIWDGVTTICSSVFANNKKVGNVVLPNSIVSIEDNAFEYSSIMSVSIPDSVSYIGERAFQHCYNLNKISIEGNPELNDWIFYSCTNLTEATVLSTNIGNNMFWGCSKLSKLNMSNSLISFGTGAFRDCSSLKQIIIPETVTLIRGICFEGCTSISEMICHPEIAPNLESSVFGSGGSSYMGYLTKGNNILRTKTQSTGYDQGQWNDPLCNPEKCGFNWSNTL